MVSLTGRIAEKDMVTMLEKIKSSDEPPSVKYRRLGAIAADEAQQLNLWKGMLGHMTLRFVSFYQDVKPEAPIEDLLRTADERNH
ncbi:hypothetical protein Ciccas_001451 [Cichlidogyrus casuarinus]|uniref:Uncharacterized protein n=1 Tax=Cichlidogyrus casuarinus TaxID=1844966 RepID=A0ABD2QK30_9PLAT